MWINILVYSIVIGGFIVIMHIVNQSLGITTYEIQSSRIPNEFKNCKIALICDLHSHSLGQDNKKLLEAIHKQKPDYIMIAGDMIIGKKDNFDSNVALQLIGKLTEHYPVYYAPGNHEYRLANEDETKDTTYVEYRKSLEQCGVVYLENQQAFIKRNGQSICVTGLAIDMDLYKKIWHKPIMPDNYVETLVGKSSDDTYHILIAHTPQYFEQYANWGADLILSGHVHGGIMILPGLGGVIAPNYRLFPKYDYGRFEKNNSTMILSRGLGSHTIKVRIGNNPELVMIKLLG